MPELPEVETSRRGIAPYVEGQTLAQFIARFPTLRWPIPVESIKALEGQPIQHVSRRGKYIKLEFSNAYVLLHLGMSGNVRIVDAKQPAGKHDHVDFVLSSGQVLRLNDPRRFGCCLYHEGKQPHPLLEKLGPEPLSDDFSEEYFYQQSRNKTKPVKLWLMDSHLVVGVGNIYACEALHKAGISPKKAVGKISKKRLMKLRYDVRETLAQAIEQGGTTLKDFVNVDGKPGYFKQQLLVYGREGLPCNHCHSPIKNIKLGNRSTFYCPSCQKY